MKTKTRMGRPKLPKNEKKTGIFQLRFLEEDLKKLEAMAEKEGIKIAELVRRIIAEKLEKV